MMFGEMDKVTDYWCVECGQHADIIHEGKEYYASCYLEKFGGGD